MKIMDHLIITYLGLIWVLGTLQTDFLSCDCDCLLTIDDDEVDLRQITELESLVIVDILQAKHNINI